MKTRNHITAWHCRLLAGAALGAIPALTHGATITWLPATNITPGSAGDLDVLNGGALVGAFNIGPGPVNATVNGVAFAGLNLSGVSTTSGNFSFTVADPFLSSNTFGFAAAPFNTLSASYQAMLSSACGAFSSTPITLTMSGLTAGQPYAFEWWSNDSSSSTSFTTIAAAGNSVTLNSNTSLAPGGIGQFAVGSFLADPTHQQVVTFTGPAGQIISGIQLRAVPEPASTVTLLCSGLAVLVRRRRASARGGSFRRRRKI
jgi:hypothetical protein